MKNILVLFIAIAAVSCGNPAKKELVNKPEMQLDSISIMPNWGDERTVNIQIVNTVETIDNGESEIVHATIDGVLKMAKTANNTWDCTWHILDRKSSIELSPMKKKYQELSDKLISNFTLDSVGAYLTLNNWEDHQKNGFELVDLTIEEFKQNHDAIDRDELDDILEESKLNFRSMFNTKEKVEALYMARMKDFFMLSGINMNIKDTLRKTDYTVSLIASDNELIKLNTIITYQKAYSDSTCDIRVVQNITEPHIYNSITKVLHAYQSTIDYNISLKTGLPEKITFVRYSKIDDIETIENTEIIRK